MKAIAVLALTIALGASAEVSGPVAVMPFKNLNADPKLEWLRAGVSETLVADLKKSRRVAVVERDQVDKALAEILLQGKTGAEESTAARVGKLVGAKTIVVGSFQEAGKDLRIVARFVRVETGEVLDTAKVTGPLTQVFGLQDQILSRLLGEKSAGVARKAGGEKTVRAYRLYAMSLTTASDADRVGFLKQSLEQDPQFSYAVEDLQKLEQRMKGYQQRADAAAASQMSGDLAKVSDASASPLERGQAAMTLLMREMTAHQIHRLEHDAAEIVAMNLDGSNGMNPTEAALNYQFLALHMLKQEDRALAVGEQLLKRFPSGMYFQGVKSQMEQIIDERRKEAAGRATTQEALAKLEAQRLEREQDAAQHHRELSAVARCAGAFHVCTTLREHFEWERAVAECSAFHDQWRTSSEPTCRKLAFTGAQLSVLSQAELGRFSEAHARVEELSREEPELTKQWLAPIAQQWPRD